MSEKMSLKDTIVPKSDQLNYDDTLSGPITVKIKTLKAGDEKQPVVIHTETTKPYKPCKSMRRVLIAAWGDKGKDWIGKSMVLYGDPSVKYGGVEVGGIRISHVSEIDEPLILKLTITRGTRAKYTVKPLGGELSEGVDERPYVNDELPM